jgi:hypothetical protein
MATLPHNIAQKLKDYPAIAFSLELVYDKPSLPKGYKPEFVEIFCDQKLAFQFANGYVTHEIYVPENYKPKTIEWAIDGEIVCVLVEGEMLFTRLENPLSMPKLAGFPSS